MVENTTDATLKLAKRLVRKMLSMVAESDRPAEFVVELTEEWIAPDWFQKMAKIARRAAIKRSENIDLSDNDLYELCVDMLLEHPWVRRLMDLQWRRTKAWLFPNEKAAKCYEKACELNSGVWYSYDLPCQGTVYALPFSGEDRDARKCGAKLVPARVLNNEKLYSYFEDQLLSSKARWCGCSETGMLVVIEDD